MSRSGSSTGAMCASHCSGGSDPSGFRRSPTGTEPVIGHTIIARKLMQEIRQPSAIQAEALTPREVDVLKCLTRGLSNQEIARELSISMRTVTTHVRTILDKLHLANRTQAALYAVEQGIQEDYDL